jgi:putative Holliday junction resolvase
MSNIIEISQLPALPAHNMRIMGLDLGTKTIGIAISDVRLTIATARQTLFRRKFTLDAEALVSLASKEDIFAFVIGLPLNMDGTEGPRAQATRAFIRNMLKHTELPFVLWDERLSTVAAEEAMIEADISRKKRAEKIDAVAAAIILQGALDRLQQH